MNSVEGPPTEDTLAEGFIDSLSSVVTGTSEFVFIHERGHWLRWDGRVWAQDRTREVADRLRGFLRESAEILTPRQRESLGKLRTLSAVERFAQIDRRCAQPADRFDAGPDMLNTQSGIVDLRTGGIWPHDAAQFMSKITTAGVGGRYPGWLGFLDQITDGDADLQAYLRRVAGYCLTGSTADYAFFFLYGSGANGKGVFLGTLTRVLGAYAVTAPMSTFTHQTNPKHEAEVAMLAGARLVVAQETEAGARWAESKIKAITGGDPITACFKFRDHFTFQPQFKLLIAGNHKPALRSVDESMRRRLHLVPFAVTIPPEQRDLGLQDALMQEADGILQWAIEGCMEWRRIGLSPPPAVRAATEEYFVVQDSLQQWIEECCEVDPSAWQAPSILFSSWRAWAEGAGEFVGNLRVFGDRLAGAGFERVRSAGTRYHRGLRILPGGGCGLRD